VAAVVASVVIAVLVATAAVALSAVVQQQISVARDDNGSGAEDRRWPARSACLACWLALVALAKKCGSDLNDNPVEHDKQKRT
jgi:hypothetical protein